MFQKGQTGNPKGTILPKDLAQAKTLNKRMTLEIFNKCIFMTLEQLNMRLKDPTTCAIELAICRVLVKAIELGDDRRINFLLDRLVGKVTEKVELQLPKPKIIKLVGEDAAVMIGRMREDDEGNTQT